LTGPSAKTYSPETAVPVFPVRYDFDRFAENLIRALLLALLPERLPAVRNENDTVLLSRPEPQVVVDAACSPFGLK